MFGLSLLAASMPNPLACLPIGIFFAFMPLFIMNRRSSGLRRFLVNLLYSEASALIILIPLDAANLVFSCPDVLLLLMSFSIIASIYALSFSLSALLSDRCGWNFSPLFFAMLWTLTQLLLSRFLFAFPVETALAQYPLIIQSAKIFGAGCIGFLIIFTNALLANALFKNDHRSWSISLAVLIAIHLINLGYGSYSISCNKSAGPSVELALIQPNICAKKSQLIEESKLFEKIFSKRLLSITREALKKRPALVIWPELSGNYLLQNDEYLGYIHKEITSKGAELLLGTNYIDYSVDRNKYNIAFILKTDGDMTEPYRKIRVFPFFETQAYRSGSQFKTLQSGTLHKNIGCMICLESMCPEIAKNLVRSGANILVCISTDAAFGNSMVPYIHCAQIILRAIENDRYAVHLGNTGPSIVCDNKGRIIAQIPYGRSAYAIAFAYVVR